MKSLIIIFIATIFSFSNAFAQLEEYVINTDYAIPKLEFVKGNKHKERKKRYEVEVPQGKMVTFRLTETINASEMTVGQHIQLKVDGEVVQDGITVINSDSYALGRVKKIKQSTINCKETLTLEVTYVKSIDGQQINMNGLEQNFSANRPGQSLTLHAGKQIIGYFKNNEIITVK